MICMVALTGCSSSRGGNPNSATSGLAVQLTMRDDSNAAALYRVNQDGEISFAGGTDAYTEKISWTGELSDDEIARLREVLTDNGYFESGPRSSATDADRRYEVELRWPDGDLSYSVNGRGLRIAALEDYLIAVSSKRFDDVMQALPQADVEE